MVRRALALLALLPGLALGADEGEAPFPLQVADERGFNLAAEAHGSLLSDLADHTPLNLTFGWGLKLGHRWDRWGALLQVEQNLWHGMESASRTVPGSLNLGLGVELRHTGGWVRTSLSSGVAILLYDTVLDEAGSVGFFLDLRPSGLRWPLGEHWRVVLDPISFAVVAPVLTSIPLVQFEYRTVLALERLF